MKLFNLLVKELGPLFLEKGIQVDSDTVSELFNNRRRRLLDGCRVADLDGKPIEPKRLIEMELPPGDVSLQVMT